MRLYKTGTIWCVWRWSEVDSKYITRLHLIKTPWFAICLHWIHKPDPEPYLHDHPVSFLSVVLRGGYFEGRIIDGVWKFHKVNWYNFMKANRTDAHSIERVKPNTLTLCFMGPKVQEWGFHTNLGWVSWKDYYKEQRKSK